MFFMSMCPFLWRMKLDCQTDSMIWLDTFINTEKKGVTLNPSMYGTMYFGSCLFCPWEKEGQGCHKNMNWMAFKIIIANFHCLFWTKRKSFKEKKWFWMSYLSAFYQPGKYIIVNCAYNTIHNALCALMRCMICKVTESWLSVLWLVRGDVCHTNQHTDMERLGHCTWGSQ